MTHLLASVDAVLMEVVTLLRGDVEIMSRVSGIYSSVPDHADLPYIVMHDVRVTASEVQQLVHGELSFALDIWSDAQSIAEIIAIAAAIEPSLQRDDFILPDHTHLSALIVEQSQTDTQQQGALHRMRVSCRANITYLPT